MVGFGLSTVIEKKSDCSSTLAWVRVGAVFLLSPVYNGGVAIYWNREINLICVCWYLNGIEVVISFNA